MQHSKVLNNLQIIVKLFLLYYIQNDKLLKFEIFQKKMKPTIYALKFNIQN